MRFRDQIVKPKRPKKGTSRAKRRALEKNARIAACILDHALPKERIEEMLRDVCLYGESWCRVSWENGEVRYERV